MSTQEQIAFFEQRLFKGKLHIPNGRGGPKCERQLNNHRASRSQQADQLEYANSPEEFTYQLLSQRACKHCAYASGLLVKPVQRVIAASEDEEEFGDE